MALAVLTNCRKNRTRVFTTTNLKGNRKFIEAILNSNSNSRKPMRGRSLARRVWEYGARLLNQSRSVERQNQNKTVATVNFLENLGKDFCVCEGIFPECVIQKLSLD